VNRLTLREDIGMILPRRLRRWEPLGGGAFVGGAILNNDSDGGGIGFICGGGSGGRKRNLEGTSEVFFGWVGCVHREGDGDDIFVAAVIIGIVGGTGVYVDAHDVQTGRIQRQHFHSRLEEADVVGGLGEEGIGGEVDEGFPFEVGEDGFGGVGEGGRVFCNGRGCCGWCCGWCCCHGQGWRLAAGGVV